ncbi:hypothetical protein ACOSQ3_006778 [Xanthoceras sorbifolium]
MFRVKGNEELSGNYPLPTNSRNGLGSSSEEIGGAEFLQTGISPSARCIFPARLSSQVGLGVSLFEVSLLFVEFNLLLRSLFTDTWSESPRLSDYEARRVLLAVTAHAEERWVDMLCCDKELVRHTFGSFRYAAENYPLNRSRVQEEDPFLAER